MVARAMIELVHLHRYFGQTRAVDDVSFQVREGQVFGYIGPNGAGKTTSMRILATLDLPGGGDAFVDGFSVLDDPDRVRRRLGFMPDFFGTYANVDVAEYLDFYARAYHLRGDARHKAIGRVMEFTRLDMLADKPIQGLSKGMKQRLCLGRTLIHNPPVLVLDEPAAGLDPRARIELREMIRALANEGKTILISSHILTELAEMCDVVGIIERGRLIAVGSVEEIHRQGQSPLNLVEVRLLDAADELCRWLAERPGVTEIRAEGERLRFLYAGEPDAEAQLLKGMILAGFRVIAFGTRRRSLEDVFMQVTQGFVQ
jgi:ABC-2 type transport system ATP-binding protein